MSNWTTYRLGDICTLIAGFAFKGKDFGNYPDKVIKIADIQPPIVDMSSLTGIDISQYNSHKLEKYKIQIGDYVLAMTGATIGKLGRITSEQNAYINQRVLLFKPKGIYVDKNYLYYYLCQDVFYSYIRNHIDSETAQPNISANSIGEFTLILPPLDEQRRIAGILGSLDDKIELNRRINANLEAQAQALFRSWFVDNETIDLQSYELGEVATIMAGGDKPSVYSKDLTEQCRIPIYSNGINNEGLYGYTDSAKISSASITVSARGTIGYVCLRTKPYVPIVRLISVVPTKAELSAEFLYLWALTQNIRGTGTTQQQLTVPDFRKTSIKIPSTKVLKKFNNIIIPIFQNVEANKNECMTLSTLRDTLLPKLLSGEIKC